MNFSKHIKFIFKTFCEYVFKIFKKVLIISRHATFFHLGFVCRMRTCIAAAVSICLQTHSRMAMFSDAPGAKQDGIWLWPCAQL